MELTLDQALQKGIEAHKAGKAQEADQYYTAILKSNPKHPDANHNMGVLAIGVGKVEQALPFFKTALEANPGTAQFWLSYIDALIKLERIADAKELFNQAKSKGAKGDGFDQIEKRLVEPIQLDSDQDNRDILKKAVLLRDNGNYNEAISLLKDGISQFPKNPELLTLLSHCYILTNNLTDASIYLEKAKSINPNIASVGWNETRILLKQKKINEALAVAYKTNKLFPNDIEGMNVLGSCLRANGSFDEGLKYLNKALNLKSDFAEAFINRGLIWLKQENKGKALADFENAHKHKPHIKQIWNLLLNLKIEANDFENTINISKEMVKIDPLNEKIFANIGLCYQHLENFDDAIAAYNKAIEIKPDYAEAYYNMGVALQKQLKLAEAIGAYTKAISIKPDITKAYTNMGVVLQKQGNLDDAIEAYKKAIKIKPSNSVPYLNMGFALKDQGRIEDARAAYKKAVEIKPNNVEAHWNLSGIAADISESKYWVKKCLEADPDHLKAKLKLSALRYYEGDKSDFNELMKSSLKDHEFMRSFNWVFNLPKLPPLHFHRWALFDHMVQLSQKDRPFYEFGVWRGEAFRYLINTFKKGYGFDTFEGLPEDWHKEKAGSYSSDGNVPKIKGGKFIVGKFEDTLPSFFAETKPMASIINFDADLYSSTICALNYAKPVMDKHTILIFDEFIISETWEQDEYKALEEFCSNNQFTYDVLAVSFFTKQVAVKLSGI